MYIYIYELVNEGVSDGGVTMSCIDGAGFLGSAFAVCL